METPREIRYWVIKTREGRGGRDYWDRFFNEGVIAVGWEDILVRPLQATLQQLETSVREAYHGENRQYGARVIKRFISIAIDDRVLICRGYAPNQIHNVYVYGFATVTGSFYDDAASDWWAFKHTVDIRPIERFVSLSIVRQSLDRQSLLQTLHEVGRVGFQQLESQLP